ncbi:MAG TPA: hypothetical protein VM367_12900 [Pseudonocardia sp.]|jgi:hypothetical protein|nr:hypothetical protein [Pseudonocardia sp.]
MTRVRTGALLAVEVPAPGIRVVRVAGDLDDAAALRIKALAKVLLDRVLQEAPRAGEAHLVMDLACVRWFGDTVGPAALLALRDDAASCGVGVHLTGLSGRQLLLPGCVADLLSGVSTYPTVEVALRELTGPPREVDRGMRTLSGGSHPR